MNDPFSSAGVTLISQADYDSVLKQHAKLLSKLKRLRIAYRKLANQAAQVVSHRSNESLLHEIALMDVQLEHSDRVFNETQP